MQLSRVVTTIAVAALLPIAPTLYLCNVYGLVANMVVNVLVGISHCVMTSIVVTMTFASMSVAQNGTFAVIVNSR